MQPKSGRTGRTPAQPSAREPKQERARLTKQRILWAAAEVFTEHGYPLVTLQAVADRASMTKGAVYFHYANKEALAVAVVQGHYERWGPLLEETRARELAPLEALRAVLRRAAEAFRDDIMIKAGARLQIEHSLIGADLPEPYVGWQELLASMITQAQEAGELRSDVSSAVLARVIVAAFFGAQHISDVLTGRADLMERHAEVVEAVLRGAVP